MTNLSSKPPTGPGIPERKEEASVAPANGAGSVHDPLLFENPSFRYLNREISWLAFNGRVLEEASNPHNPPLERVKFLSICASNLEEFFMVRVAELMDRARIGSTKTSCDGLTAAQQLEKILPAAYDTIRQQQKCWSSIKEILAKKKIFIANKTALSSERKKWLEKHFMDSIFPAITPISVDPSHPFPFLPTGSITTIYSLEEKATGTQMIALLLLPQKMPRFVEFPRENNTVEFIALEDVIDIFIDMLFPGYKPLEKGLFHILRDSEFTVGDEMDNIAREFERALKQRKHGEVVMLMLDASMPHALRSFLSENLKVEPRHVFEIDGFVGLSKTIELLQIERPDLKFTPFTPRYPERIKDYNGDCFAAIQAKDIVIHHPYESFDVVVHFLRQAAQDPDVVSIKQTLYRTSSDSSIVKALIEAAEAGKAVTAVIELKARFDEETNIRFARDMERAGVQVVYGIVNLKTHAKVSLVVKRVAGALQSFVHFGTGNYHPVTAKIYTDVSFFTCDAALCQDAAKFFNYLTGYAQPHDLKKLIVSPLNLRQELMKLIDAEIANAKLKKPAHIWAKMNSLVDKGIIDALYKASQAGVEIELVVRGICTLRPGVPGLSDNIHVISIVGRFLEHSRIFCFGDGHVMPSPEAKVFISSADWMPRNLDRRVEYMVRIENKTVHQQILNQIMVTNLLDDVQAWELGPDGSYQRIPSSGKLVSAHQYFMSNPSLSGRGSAQNPRRALPRRVRKHVIRHDSNSSQHDEEPQKGH